MITGQCTLINDSYWFSKNVFESYRIKDYEHALKICNNNLNQEIRKENCYNVLLFAYAFEKYKYGTIDGIIENYRVKRIKFVLLVLNL